MHKVKPESCGCRLLRFLFAPWFIVSLGCVREAPQVRASL
jgi:hypothetical protein